MDDHNMIIEHRYCGPDDSGNGGYSSGLLAQALHTHEPIEVRLKAPPPLDRALRVLREGNTCTLHDGETLVGVARPSELNLRDVGTAVSLEQAQAMSSHYAPEEHPIPHCFTCGPRRGVGDGLRIFASRAGEEGPVAAPWTPAPDLASASGAVRAEIVWAALDCPGYFAHGKTGYALLGTMTAQLLRPVATEAPHVVMAWRTGAEGRKLMSTSAIFDAEGALCAASSQVWIRLQREG